MRFHTARIDRTSRHGSRDELVTLTELTYELLDAHADTQRLAGAVASEADWESHLAYLRDLQRVGREALARAGQPLARWPRRATGRRDG